MKIIFVSLALIVLSPLAAYAKPCVTGLPLPRFASLRSKEVNLRAGPGSQYPTTWVVKRRHLPVKVIAEHENWRKIQLHDDTIGWVFQSMLSGNKTVLVKKSKTHLRRSPNLNGLVIAHLHQYVIGHLKQCKEGWCKANFDRYNGWIEQSSLWGAEFEKK
jgi:SH3-like domain-containing protein